jgi:glycine cleavage system transcriptional repressor
MLEQKDVGSFMRQFLLITIVGETKSTHITIVTQTLLDYSCVIEKSRLVTIGNHWVWVAQVNGPWNHITKLETALPAFAKANSLTISSRRCSEFAFEQDMLPYTITVTSLASESLLHELCNFFDSMDAIIHELYTQQGQQPSSKQAFDTLIIRFYLLADTQLSDFREQFLLLCDELNVDAVIDPEK